MLKPSSVVFLAVIGASPCVAGIEDATVRDPEPATALAPAESAASGAPTEASAKMAFRASLGGTLVPLAAGLSLILSSNPGSSDNPAGVTLALGGLIVGPSLGYFYAGCTRPAIKGIVTRLLVSGATATATVLTSDTGYGLPWLIAAAGGVTLIVEAGRDVARVRGLARAAPPRAALVPVYLPGERTVGVAFVLKL